LISTHFSKSTKSFFELTRQLLLNRVLCSTRPAGIKRTCCKLDVWLPQSAAETRVICHHLSLEVITSLGHEAGTVHLCRTLNTGAARRHTSQAELEYNRVQRVQLQLQQSSSARCIINP